jgi:hypothetical protein
MNRPGGSAMLGCVHVGKFLKLVLCWGIEAATLIVSMAYIVRLEKCDKYFSLIMEYFIYSLKFHPGFSNDSMASMSAAGGLVYA